MKVLPLSERLKSYLEKRKLNGSFIKQVRLFEQNPFHTSLNSEILEPRRLKIYSFRITQKYRAIFIYRGSNTIEIIDINDHYH